MVEIRPAATVVLLRDAPDGLHTLLLRRNSALGFAAGAWVFPGGRVDDAEIAAASDALDAARQAAVRETLEEAQLVIDASALRYYAHWTTPPGRSKRYATWFFAARAPEQYAVTVDGSEIEDHLWVRPLEALELQRREEIEMMPPTFAALTELAVCADVEEVLARVARRTAPVFEPHIVMQGERMAISLYEGDAGYAACDAGSAGPRHRLVMAPGNWQYLNDGVVPW
jgi:8-oxo-dGTP pyrophosphatase MutT (NUDIX family)